MVQNYLSVDVYYWLQYKVNYYWLMNIANMLNGYFAYVYVYNVYKLNIHNTTPLIIM